jgi:hypothetical protein
MVFIEVPATGVAVMSIFIPLTVTSTAGPLLSSENAVITMFEVITVSSFLAVNT